MPEAIAAAASFIATTGIEIAGVSISTQAILTVATMAYQVNQQRRVKQKLQSAYQASLKDRELTLRSAVAPRRYVYGKDRISGPLIYAETTGDKKQYLHLVIALAAHECDGIEQVWFGDEVLPEPDAAGLIQSGTFFKGTTRADQAYLPPTSGAVTLPRAASRVVGITYSQGDSGQLVATGWSHTPGTATITGLPDVGMVTVEYEWFDGQPRVRIKKHLGQPGQVVDADLVAESDGKWTAAHKGTGICYAYMRLEWDEDIFSNGLPEMKFVVRGRKMADARTSTVTWSDNAALAVADWLQRHEGLRAATAQVPSAEVIDAANISDEAVTLHDTGTVNVISGSDQVTGNSPDWRPSKVKPGMFFYGPDGRAYLIAGVFGVLPVPRITLATPYIGTTAAAQAYSIGHRRYTFNGSFTSEESPRDVLQDLLQSMAGTAVWTQGRWLVRAGAHRTPAPAITPAMLAGAGVVVTPKASRSQLFNAVRVTYRDPDQGWAEVQAPLVTNAMYEAQDGGTRRVRSIQIASAMDAIRAQRLGKIELERARQAMTVQLSTNLRGYNLAPGDVVPLDFERYGWAGGKLFTVEERTFSPADGVLEYALRETAAGVWAWNYGEATTVDLAPDTSLPNPYARPPALTGLAVASGTAHLLRQVDGTLLTRAYVTWTASADAFVRQGGRIELRWRAAGTEQWQAEPPLPGDAASAYVAPVPDGTAVTFSVRQVNAVGSASDWVALMVTVLGKTEPPSDVTGLTSSVAAGVIRWAWDTCPDIDYQATEVRATDADWGSDANPPLWRGRVSEWPENVTATGTYTRHVRHLDTGGRPSANTATRAQVVASGDLGGDAAVQPALVLTPALATIQADADGIVPSWAGTQTVATVVLPDGSDDTTGWAFSKADQGVVSTIAGNVITVTGWDTASGAVDPYWAQTLFLARFNGSLAEERRGRRLGYLLQDDPTPDWVTDGGDTWLQLGNSTGATAGTNWGVVQVEPTSDLLAETGDMVIEGRWRMESIPSRPRTLIALVDATGAEIYRIGWDVGGQHQMTVRTAAGSTASQYGGPSVTAGTEYHVAMVRVGNVHTIYVNGLAAGTTITTSYRHPAGARWVVMAASSTGAGAYNDYGFVRLGWARITAGTHRNYTSTFTPAINPPLGYLTQAAVEVTGTKSGQELVRRFEILTQRAAYGGEEAATGTLSRDLIALPADWAGTVASYTGASTTLSIRRGAVDITHLYTLSRSNGANVNSGLSGATLSITSLTIDASTVTITATRAGYPSITATVQVTRARTPQPVVNISGPASVVVAGDTSGTVPSASLPVAVAATASDAGTDVTGSYAWVVSASAGITLSSTTSPSTTITAMSSGTDSGSITWTGTRTNWPTLSWRASVSKTRLLLPSGAIVASLPAISIFDDASAATVGLRLTSDGRVQVYRQNATGAWVTVANFYNPTTTSIGSGYRVRLLGTPAGSTAGTWNAWQALSSDVTWQAGSEVGGGVGSHGWTLHQIQIAATGSTDILATYLVTATAIVEGS